MADILEKIVARKQIEVAERKAVKHIGELMKSPYFSRETYSFKDALQQTPFGIIAEFKRQSPSKGLINGTAKPEEVTKAYAKAGVSAVSVLTDIDFFGGSDEDLLAAREGLNIPMLRKDFMVDDYQLYEAKAIGADIILLIAAALKPAHLKSLAKTAKQLGLNVFLEVHNQQELEECLCDETDVVGINNRNLKTFEVSIQTSIDLVSMIPDSFAKVSESGISSAETITKLKPYGFDGFLIGENFMKTDNPGAACEAFFKELHQDA